MPYLRLLTLVGFAFHPREFLFFAILDGLVCVPIVPVEQSTDPSTFHGIRTFGRPN